LCGTLSFHLTTPPDRVERVTFYSIKFI